MAFGCFFLVDWCTAVNVKSVDKVCGLIGLVLIYDKFLQCWRFKQLRSAFKLNVRRWSNLNISAWNLSACCHPHWQHSAKYTHVLFLSVSRTHSLFIYLLLADFPPSLLPILLSRYLWRSKNSHIPYELFLHFYLNISTKHYCERESIGHTVLYTTCEWFLSCIILLCFFVALEVWSYVDTSRIIEKYSKAIKLVYWEIASRCVLKSTKYMKKKMTKHS